MWRGGAGLAAWERGEESLFGREVQLGVGGVEECSVAGGDSPTNSTRTASGLHFFRNACVLLIASEEWH
jgi:hypothetical protein